jgi:hypothetical protein
MKAIVYAGLLSHYAADLAMPLHASIHWDGRAHPDGSSPRTGIHLKVDALPTHLPFNTIFDEPIAPLDTPATPADLFALVVAEVHATREHVETTYQLEPDLPGARSLKIEDDRVKAFTIDRTRRAAAFTATLLLTAWQHSADIDLPWWLHRDAFSPEGLDRDAVPTQPTPPTDD